MSVIPILRRQRQKDYDSEVGLSYPASTYFRKKSNKIKYKKFLINQVTEKNYLKYYSYSSQQG